MPNKRSVRRTRKKSTIQVPRYSSLSSGFGGNNLVSSSPNSIADSTVVISEEPVLITYENYKMQYEKNRGKLIRLHETDLDDWKSFVFGLRLKLSADIADIPLRDVKEKENISEINDSVTSTTFLKPIRPVRKGKQEDDGFKRPLEPRKTRKTSASSTKSSSSKFKTPDLSSQMKPDLSALTITPKMNPNTPMNMMRRPRQGEVAVSMTGSPLLVSTVLHDELPTVTVPFSDGRVFSILPNPGAAPDDMPEFDEQTKQLLKALQDNLERCCGKK